MKNQKGITLVALIITIIVMLILVAVTISVAMNGGLFDTARKASKETKTEQVKEAVTLAKAEALSYYYEHMKTADGQINKGKFQEFVNGYLENINVTVDRDTSDATVFKITNTSDAEVNEALGLPGTPYVVSFGTIAIATGN